MKPRFSPGKNIAIKVPNHEFEQTVTFYRDVLGLEEADASSPDDIKSVVFKFGDVNLWIDKIGGMSQAEVWLEVVTDDLKAASQHLADAGCARRDEIEPLPESVKGFWVANPANIIHLVSERTGAE